MKNPFIKAVADNAFIPAIPCGMLAIAWTLTGGNIDLVELFFCPGFIFGQIIFIVIFVVTTIARWSYLSEKGGNR